MSTREYVISGIIALGLVFGVVAYGMTIGALIPPRDDAAKACHDLGGGFIPDHGNGYSVCMRGPR